MKTLGIITLIILVAMLSSCSFFDKLIEAKGYEVETPTTTEDVRG